MKTLHATNRPAYYRTVWISDVHLGFSGCKAEFLLDFLHSTRCDQLYLVGDIIDVWCMKKRLYWPQEHNNVVRTLLGKAKHGTRVVYVPGNHDEVFRDHVGLSFGNLSIQNRVIHTTADGRRFLVTHGDEFDTVVQCSKAVALLGTKAYDWLLRLNGVVNQVRRRFGFGYWSLAAFMKHKVKTAVQYMSSFESAVAYEAARQRVDGLICGHIHRAEITHVNGVLYCNSGDWVESCTALVELHDGTLELIHWSDACHSLKQVKQVQAAA
jgi:UDP-2,3-diacylglucosamine pyrophosphatase LpxH